MSNRNIGMNHRDVAAMISAIIQWLCEGTKWGLHFYQYGEL